MSTSPICHPLLRHSLLWQTSRVAALGLLLAWSRGALAEEPTADEVHYAPTELPPEAARGRLLLAGAALTAGWYGVGVGTSYLWRDAPNARDLRLPVVGPWMSLGNVGCGSNEGHCTTLTVVGRTALAVVSGVGQFGGLVALTEGIFLKTSSGAASPRAALDPARDEAGARTWAAVPVALPDGAGIEFVGRF
jgi:hypothetical protein